MTADAFDVARALICLMALCGNLAVSGGNVNALDPKVLGLGAFVRADLIPEKRKEMITAAHGVIPRFMIQGGGFYRNSNGVLVERDNLYAPIKLETRSDLKHLDGAVAMARTNDPNSATSQFYICMRSARDAAYLNEEYAVFGSVTSGMDVVKQITTQDKVKTIKVLDDE